MPIFWAARRKPSLAVASSTPSISYMTRPGLTTATQNSGLPLPLPIRVSAGFFVTGLSGKIRMKILPRRLTLRGQHLALEDPDLDPDGPVRGVGLGQAVVDVGPDRVQRHPPVAIPLAPRDLRATQAPGAGDPDAVRAQPERGGHRLFHGPAEGDALLQLQRHVLGHQLRVELRMDHLFDVEVDLLGRARLDLVLELFHLGALAADDDPGPRGEDGDPGPVGRALDVDPRDPRVVERGLDEP